MTKTLVIFEFADEIDSFVSNRSLEDLKNKDNLILAILPEAQAHLRRMSIPYSNTYSFFGKEEHKDALLQSDIIYKFGKSLLDIEDDLGIKEGYKNTYLLYMRFYVHYILWLIEIINNACRRGDIKKIIAFRRNNKHNTDPLLSNHEGHAAEIGKMIAGKLNIGYESFQVKNINLNLFFSKVMKYLKEMIKFIIYHIKRRDRHFISENNNFILISSEGYNLNRVIEDFKEKYNGLQAVYLSGKKEDHLGGLLSRVNKDKFISLPTLLSKERRSTFLGNLTAAIDRFEGSKGSDEVFTYRGINIKDIMFRKLRCDIIPTLCNIYAQSLYLDRFLKRHRPAMIISQMGRHIYYNLAELSSLYNIPSVMITHGSHVPPKNEYEMIEWKEHGLGLMNSGYKYVAVQSPWAKTYLEKVPTMGEQIITGPLLFAKGSSGKDGKKMLRKKLIPECEDKIILLHADTPRQRMAMRLYVYQTVDEYIYSINSLIKAVEKNDDFYLIVRFRPLHYLSKEDIMPLLVKSDCYSIHSQGAFDEYLSIADMLVSYSSTTIEEALQNKVPVLLYDSQGKYCHIEGQTLDPSLNPNIDSCYYIKSENKLLWGLKWLAENHFSNKISESVWKRHIFSDSEKVTLPNYFKNLFHREHIHGNKN